MLVLTAIFLLRTAAIVVAKMHTYQTFVNKLTDHGEFRRQISMASVQSKTESTERSSFQVLQYSLAVSARMRKESIFKSNSHVASVDF
ncbi:MAG: hypothetical protein HQ517_08435 [SAR324 cluster bacterium]|nr:hypothetical protein [SAR324 cluster bacterium]